MRPYRNRPMHTVGVEMNSAALPAGNTAIAFKHFDTEGRQCCAAPPRTARRRYHDGSVNARLILWSRTYARL
jgi:hypothetical protein